MHARNPRIVEVARLLGRTASSVAMKLVNFASLDRAQQARGIKGLANHTRADQQAWNDFQSNWEEMSLISETRLQALQSQRASEAIVTEIGSVENAVTEIESMIKVRTTRPAASRATLLLNFLSQVTYFPGESFRKRD